MGLWLGVVISIRPLSMGQIDITTPGQSEPGSNCNEGELYNPQSSRIGAQPTVAV